MTRFFAMEISPNYYLEYGFPFGEKKYGPPCPECGRPSGGPILPISVRFIDRPSKADFVWSPPELLVTNQVKRAFQTSRVQGVGYSRVIIKAENFEPSLQPPLWHLLIHQAAHAASQMHVVPRRRCLVCGIVDYSTWDGGVVIDETTWDGSDIFRLHEDVVGFIASEKVQRIATANRFTGVIFVPAATYQDPFSESRPRPTG